MSREVAVAIETNGEWVMFTWTIGQERKTNLQMRVSAKSPRLVGLLSALILMSIVVNALVILADSNLS
jgi:hypothetical protein